ncbi:hypothetical protein L7F22_050119 [Adiantum nelumboides]|nr:hypothetical protein [Adiantum nelumboides]
MRDAFGKTHGTCACIDIGQVSLIIWCKDNNSVHGQEAFCHAKSYFLEDRISFFLVVIWASFCFNCVGLPLVVVVVVVIASAGTTNHHGPLYHNGGNDTSTDIKMAPKMARKRKLTFLANIDMVSGEPRRWYIDIYNVQCNKLPRPHVLICNLEDKDSFEDVGQLWSVCMSVLDSNPDIQCLDIFILGKLSYHLLPQAYATDCMVSNKEDTMFSRGWNIEANDAANFTCEMLQLAISEIQQWKPPKAGDDESKNMDEHQRQIVKELEGVQDNKAKPCNDLRDYQQNISGHDGEGPRGATEHQLEPMLLGTEVHEGTSSPTQPSSNLQDDESENEDEDQMNIVKGLEGVQVNKPNFYNNDDREYRQKLLINDIEGSHGATEHQLQPILLEAEVHEDASTLAR